MAKISLDIDDKLFEDLNRRSMENKSQIEDFILEYINLINKIEVSTMATVIIDSRVMEKVNIKCRLSHKTPVEVINEVLWENLRKIEDVPEEFDAERIWNMLDHDKPEGDDILDNITDMFE